MQYQYNSDFVVEIKFKSSKGSGLDTPPASALDLLLSLGGHFCVGLDLLLYLGS